MRLRQCVRRARLEHDTVESGQRARCGEQRLRAGPLACHHDFRGAQPQIDGVEERHVHVEVLDGGRRDRRDQPVGLFAPAVIAGQRRASRMRFCAATALWFGVASSAVEAGRTTRPSASAAVR